MNNKNSIVKVLNDGSARVRGNGWSARIAPGLRSPSPAMVPWKLFVDAVSVDRSTDPATDGVVRAASRSGAITEVREIQPPEGFGRYSTPVSITNEDELDSPYWDAALMETRESLGTVDVGELASAVKALKPIWSDAVGLSVVQLNDECIVTTDSHRLATVPIHGVTSEILAPPAILTEALECAMWSGLRQLDVFSAEDGLIFADPVGLARFFVRVDDNRCFPMWRSILPTRHGLTVEGKREDFIRLFTLAGKAAAKDKKAVAIQILADRVEAASFDDMGARAFHGAVSCRAECHGVDPRAVRLAVNAGYMLDAISLLGPGHGAVRIDIGTAGLKSVSTYPMTVTDGSGNVGPRSIVMPITSDDKADPRYLDGAPMLASVAKRPAKSRRTGPPSAEVIELRAEVARLKARIVELEGI